MPEQAIKLSVREPSGVPRKGYPLTCGVPFPEGLFWDIDELRLDAESGEEISLQVAQTVSWPGGSVKWALLDFQVDLKPTEEKLLNLHFGEGISRKVEHPHPIRVEERDGLICINTDLLSFEVASGARHPFRTLCLNGAGILQDEVPLLGVEVEGKCYVASDPDSKVFVEESGPLRAVVRCEGKYVAGDGSKLSDYIFRIYVYAGQPYLRIYYTFVNKEPAKKLEVSELSFHLPLQLSGETKGFLLGTADHYKPFRVHTTEGQEPLHLRISTEQGPNPSLRQAAPDYVVKYGEIETKYPAFQWHSPMLGSATLTDGNKGLSLMFRHAWHNAPKEFCLAPEGITLYLVPSWEQPLELYRGVAKTHEILLFLHSGEPEELEVKKEAIAFQEPMIATVATQNWMVDSGVFGPLFRYQPKKYPWYEYIFRRLFEEWIWRPDPAYHKGSTLMDFGDHWVPSRNGQWMNNEMDYGFALILEMVRTSYPVIFPWIEQVVMHQMDVDTCHDSENPIEIGSQRYHYADHGWHVPFAEQGWPFPVQLCHEWLERDHCFSISSRDTEGRWRWHVSGPITSSGR